MNPTLNPKLLESDVESRATRDGYGEGLLEVAKNDSRVVALCADLVESTRTEAFAKAYPERFIEVGVAEQNLAAVASGMAAIGKVPFISSYAMFSPGRNWEQIRTTICYNNQNVKIAGAHAGISVGADGGTHQALEDIAITRVMPRMVVLSPCDSIEAKKATIAAAEHVGPVYIRLAREKTPVVTTESTPFEIGKAQIFYESQNPVVAIVVTGTLVSEALLAAHALETEGVGSIVVNLATIKPLDEETLLSVAKRVKKIVTVEEHQVVGGMGSAVAEFLSKNHPLPIEFIGVHDEFGQSGKPSELLKHYKMDKEAIIEAVKKVITRV